MEQDDGRATITHVVAQPGHGQAVRQLELTIAEGPQAGTRWRSSGRACTIGSHPRCDLVVQDPTVSRFHCELTVDGERVRVRDMGSRNGTRVDGVHVSDAYLTSGCVVQLGNTALRADFGDRTVAVAVSERTSLGNMIGMSMAMRSTFAVLEKAAASDATVLLEGETGTGKTLAARTLHDLSARAGGPFVIVDCGAIPANLLESELFGHERGAFTGADVRRIGAFEEADGGTLFLDEIGELPLELQPKLLGALESRSARRVGGSERIEFNVRVIAATNRDLGEEVNESRFRSDLYFRLAVVKLSLPPLRDRREDLPGLAEQIVRSLGASDERVARLLTPDLIARIQHAQWPGNVRELRNYLERCLVFDEVVPVAEAPSAGGGDIAVAANLPYAEARERAIHDFERVYLSRLLSRHERVADAAKDAGIERTYFYRLLRRHGMSRS